MIKIKAFAKINLFLEIIGKHDENYHSVEMVMQSINLFDVLFIEKTTNNTFKFFSNFNFKENISKNTSFLATKEFFNYTGIKNPGININLEKNIPMCAGLAGGSADAAATLIALNKLFNTNLSTNELLEIGEKIGSDVPFCLLGGTYLATGRGTTLSPLKDLPFCYIVLCKPDVDVSTQKAYALFQKILTHQA